MTLSRAETLEYLSIHSTDADQISLVLLELGEDPDANEFPDDIVERAEQIFAVFGQAKVAALSGSQDAKSITVQEVNAIACELLESQDISIPADVIMALAQATVVQSVKIADQLSQLQEEAFVSRLMQNREQFTQKLLGISTGHSDTIDAVLGDEARAEFIHAVAPNKPVNKEAVKQFLNGLDSKRKADLQISGARERQRAALPPKRVDIKAFLAARNA